MNTLLLLSLLAVCFGYYPVDFAPGEDRTDGAAFWLEPGMHMANLQQVTSVLNVSYLELQIAPVQSDVECFYSVWINNEKLSWGSFNSATSSVIPVIFNGNFVDSSVEYVLGVVTSNCYLGRFAVPYVLGDNGDALYLQDIHPTTAENNFDVTNGEINYYPTREFGGGFDEVVALTTSYYLGTGICKFSSQACTYDYGFWMPSYFGSVPVQALWSEASFFQAEPGAEVVIENSAWYTAAFSNYYYLCNATAAGTCDTEAEYTDYDSTVYAQNDYSAESAFYELNNRGFKRAYSPAKDGFYGQSAQAFLNSTRGFYRTFYSWTQDPAGDYDPSAIIYYSFNQVVFPYLKIWALGWTDSMHVLADLRGGSNSQCNIEEGTTGLTYVTGEAYPSYGLSSYNTGALPNYGGPVAYPSNSDPNSAWANTQAWIYCGQNPAGDTALTCAQIYDQFNQIDLTGGKNIGTDAVTAPIALDNGGFINPVSFDLGVPFVYNTAGCTPTGSSVNTGSSWDYVFDYGIPYASNQLSNFNILVNGTDVGNIQQFFIGRFDRLMISGFGVEGFVLGPNAAPAIKYFSQPDFSITAPAYMQVNAFGPAYCDDTQCMNGGYCADANGLDYCTCSPLWTDQNCTTLATYCSSVNSAEYCQNGGVCMENDQRGVTVDVDGNWQYVYNVTWCDCTGTQTVANTGDYRGVFCELPAPCDLVPCFNDGACTNGVGNAFTCDCSGTTSPNSTHPFTGDHCELSGTMPCDVNPCENSGSCTDDATAEGGFTCDCTGGWGGKFCTIAPTDACTNDNTLCLPFGVCIPSADPASTVAPFAKCVCLWGYSGDDCNTAPAACARNGLECQNEGVCVGVGTAASSVAACLCVDPWVGQTCQWNYTDPPYFNNDDPCQSGPNGPLRQC